MRKSASIFLSDLSPKVRGQATRDYMSQMKPAIERVMKTQPPDLIAMRMPLFFVIPVPPSTNHLFATYGKKRIKTKKYKAWLNAAGWKIKEQTPHHIPGEVEIKLTIKRPSDRCDLDNRMKAALDLIVSMGLIEDDSHVVAIHAAWSKETDDCLISINPA